MGKPKMEELRTPGKGKGYNREKTLETLKKIAIENPNAIYVSDLYGSIGMSWDTFVKLFPKGSKDREELDELVSNNVSNVKMEIRNRLLSLNQSIGLIALYKLLGTDEEREALSGKEKTKKEEENKDITLTIS